MTKDEKVLRSELTDAGYTVAHTGWPDFIAIKDKEVRFIELKCGMDKLNPAQRAMHKILEKAFKIKVEVIYRKSKPINIYLYRRLKNALKLSSIERTFARDLIVSNKGL